jgi:hypothetical protein
LRAITSDDLERQVAELRAQFAMMAKVIMPILEKEDERLEDQLNLLEAVRRVVAVRPSSDQQHGAKE